MSVEIDKLIFTLDADLAPLRAKNAQAEAEMTAMASRVQAKTGGMFFADTTQGSANLLRMRQAVDQYTASLATGTTATKAAGQAIKDVGAATEGSRTSVYYATREFRALFDELSGGRTRLVPGTLAIIATRVFGIGLASLAAGAAILGIPAAFAYAADRSVQSIKQIETALQATGNAAGLTIDQANAAANAIASTSGLSTIGARGVISTFAGNPAIPGNIGLGLAGATPNFARATGASYSEAAKALSQLFTEPAKGAKDLADKFNLLDAGTLRQIQDLAASGQSQQAQQVLLDALNARFQNLDQQGMGLFETALHAVTKAASEAADALGRIGRGETTGEALAAAQTRLAQLQSIQAGAGGSLPRVFNPRADALQLGTGPNAVSSQIAAEQAKIAALQMVQASEQVIAAQKAQEAQQTRLIEQGQTVVSTFDLADERTRKYANDTDLLATALVAAQNQFDKLGKQIAAGLIDDPAALDRLKQLAAIIKELSQAQAGSAIAAQHQMSAADREILTLQGQAATYGVPAPQRANAQRRAQIEAQYRSDLANPQNAAAASRLRSARLSTLGAEQAAPFSDAFGASGMLGKAQFDNQQLGALANAGASPAAIQAQKELNEAIAATRDLRLQAEGPAELARVDALTNRLRNEFAARDEINRTIQANDEDRKLQQTLDEKKLELSLMTQNATLRAQELSDLATRNQLIEEGYTVGTKAFDDELAKRKAINEEIARTDVAIKAAQATQQAWKHDVQEFGSTLDSAFRTLIDSSKTWHDKLVSIENDFANLILKLLVIEPLEKSIMGAVGGIGGGSGISGLFSSLFGGGGATASGGGATTIGAAGASALGSVWTAGLRQSGVKFAAAGAVLPGPTIFSSSAGPVVGGELGANTEALVPLAWGPNGLGVRQVGGKSAPNVTVVQQISVHPDVSTVARGEIIRMMPNIRDFAIQGVQSAQRRAVVAWR